MEPLALLCGGGEELVSRPFWFISILILFFFKRPPPGSLSSFHKGFDPNIVNSLKVFKPLGKGFPRTFPLQRELRP